MIVGEGTASDGRRLASAVGPVVGRPSLLRAINERLLLDAVRAGGPMSRAQLVRVTGLSKPTVSLALSSLEDAGLVCVVGRSSGHVGAPAPLYAINSCAGWVVGVDLGRQWLRAAVADLTGQFRATCEEPNRSRSPASLVAHIGAIARRVAADAEVPWAEVVRVVVGGPGVVDHDRHQVLLAPSLPGWERRGLVDALRAQFDTPVEVDNDVNLAALGEQWAGLGPGVSHFIYLWVGTAIGLGIVVGGELLRGAHGLAGEIGYMTLSGRSTRGNGKRTRMLRQDVSAAATVRRARGLGLRGRVTAQKVFEAARDGDEIAQAVVAGEAERIALVIAAVAPVLDPELVLLGGGLAGNAELLQPVRKKLGQLSPFEPRVEISELGNRAVLHGAIATALAASWEELARRAHTGTPRSKSRTDRAAQS